MREPKFDMSVFATRRKKLGPLIEGSALILTAHPHYVRNNDVHHPYRPDTNLFYLTGFEEPGCVFVFRPGQTPETVMFVQPKDLEMETWDGFRYGPKGTVAEFGIDAAFNIGELEERLPELLKPVDKLYYQLYFDHKMDRQLETIIQDVRNMSRRSGKGYLPIEDPRSMIGEMRLRKSLYEIDALKKACDISSEAHIEVMKAIRPGVNERTLHGIFLKEIMQRGAPREGYGSIMATGNNACTLHYVFNDAVVKDGDMFLIDAGAEFDYYTGDITRTYPANGRFSETQKRIYERMLALQVEVIEMVKPGATRDDLQKHAVDRIVELMIDEKIMRGSKDKIIEEGSYRRFYPHGIGHWLGSDVHDAGIYEVNGEPRPLEPCMVLTIEPGLYVPEDTTNVPDEVRGMGVRIEDNILVTESGHDVLTAKCPKEVSDLEAVIGTQNH